MEKERARKSRKKKCTANVAEEKSCGSRSIQNDQKATKEITEAKAKQSDNEFDDDNLSDEADVLRFLLANIPDDNSDRGINEANLQRQEKHSSPSRPNCVCNSLDKGNFPHERRDLVGNNWIIEELSQERNLNEINSKSNLIEMCDEAKNIKSSGTADTSKSETISHEKDNSSDVHDKSTTNVAESPVADDLRATDQDPLKEILHIETPRPDFSVDQNSNNPGIIINTTEIKDDIEINDFPTGSKNIDTRSGTVTEKIEQPESQEENGNSGNIEIVAPSEEMNLSESYAFVTTSLKEIDNSLISDEAMKSTGDPGVRNEMISETFASEAIQKPSSPEIPSENSVRTDNDELATISWQHRSAQQSEDMENLPANESKITCGIDVVLKNTEESHSGETTKNKFYEAITGFWKYTGFSKKRLDIAGQPGNLCSELKHTSSIHSSKTSLTSTESLGTPIPPSEFTKSSEISSKPITQVTVPHFEPNIISSPQKNTVTDIASSYHSFDDQALRNSPNPTIAENFDPNSVSKELQMVTSDSSSITDEVIKDADGLLDRMEESKKCKKGKIESSNLSVFGHKVLFSSFSSTAPFSFITSSVPIRSGLAIMNG